LYICTLNYTSVVSALISISNEVTIIHSKQVLLLQRLNIATTIYELRSICIPCYCMQTMYISDRHFCTR